MAGWVWVYSESWPDYPEFWDAWGVAFSAGLLQGQIARLTKYLSCRGWREEPPFPPGTTRRNDVERDK